MTKFLLTLMTILIVVGMVIGVSALIRNAALQWKAPTTNADNTPLTDLAGFKAYCNDGTTTYTTDITGAALTTVKVCSFTPQDGVTRSFTCYVTAYDTSNNESAPSNTVMEDIVCDDIVVPSPPTGCSFSAE